MLNHQRPHFNPHGPFKALKPFTCAAVHYEDGDAFDATTVDGRQLDQLWRQRFIDVGEGRPREAAPAEVALPPPATGKRAKG